jgi:hypothetical protein
MHSNTIKKSRVKMPTWYGSYVECISLTPYRVGFFAFNGG